MESRIHTSAFLDPSSPDTPCLLQDSTYWTQVEKGFQGPSVRAHSDPEPLRPHKHARTSNSELYDIDSPESELGKPQYESMVPSSNVSGVLPLPPMPLPQPSMTRSQEVAFISITCIAQFLSLSAMNQTVAPVLVLAKYFYVEDYGTLSWFSASFSMSVGTFILPAGMFVLSTSLPRIVFAILHEYTHNEIYAQQY